MTPSGIAGRTPPTHHNSHVFKITLHPFNRNTTVENPLCQQLLGHAGVRELREHERVAASGVLGREEPRAAQARLHLRSWLVGAVGWLERLVRRLVRVGGDWCEGGVAKAWGLVGVRVRRSREGFGEAGGAGSNRTAARISGSSSASTACRFWVSASTPKACSNGRDA